MPFVIPTLYLAKSMIPKNTCGTLRNFQLKKIVSFVSILLVTNNLTSNISHNDSILHNDNNKLSYENNDVLIS